MDNLPNTNSPNPKMSPPMRMNGSPAGASSTATAVIASQGSNTPSRTPRSGTPVTTHLAVSGKSTVNHKINEKTGYQETRFAGKEEQLQEVVKALHSKGFIPHDLVVNEVFSPFIF